MRRSPQWLVLLWIGALILACATGGGRQVSAPTTAEAEALPAPVAAPEPPPALTTVTAAAADEPAAPDRSELPSPEPEALQVEESPEALLVQSLEAYESAQVFWQQGSFEDAFAALDHAFELMSGVEVNGDPWLAQQKEDLRRLISRRIVEIYASRQTVAGEMDASIPLEINDHVEREIRSFQEGERQSFLDGYERSGLYLESIQAELRDAGMPEQLAWLPMVESWFKVRALSSARALGMWQFIASTGYRFGLRRTTWVDERMDPARSTHAALAYMTELHELFGDWMTALAAYNCGESRVLRLIRNQRTGYFDQFWDLYELLPGETRRYVPRFLATLAILEDPAKYGFDDLPRPLPTLRYEEVDTARPVRLEELDRSLGLEKGSLAALNPELRHGATPDEPYRLKVPAASSAVVLASLESLPKYSPPETETFVHRVRPGETLSGIADRYRTSVSTLMRLNNLRSAHRIWPGQQLRVAGRGAPSVRVAAGGSVTYTVRRGDSLWVIANRFGTTVDRIRRDNNLGSSTLHPGQTLRVGAGSAGGGRAYTVRSGDTLGKIAAANRISASRLAEANGISLRGTIYPGQQLHLPD